MQLRVRYSVMIKLVVVFLIALLPLALLYAGTFQLSRKMLADETTASIQRRNQDFSDRFNDELQRILSTNHMLVTNWELGKLAVVPDDFSAFQKSTAIANIQDKIFLAQLSSRFIGSIDVYISSIDKCISTNMASGTMNSMRVLAANMDAITCDQFITHGGKIVLISQNTFGQADVPSLVIKTTLSMDSINEMFKKRSTDDITGGFLFNMNDSHILTSDGIVDDSSQRIVARAAEEIGFRESAAVLTGDFVMAATGVSYKVTYTYLRNGDIVVVGYFNQDDIRIGFDQMQTLLIVFAAIFASIILLIYFSLNRIVSAPLRRLMNAFELVEQGDLEVAIEARDQSEFKAIYDSFNRMVFRIKTLINQTYQQTIYLQRAQLKQLQAQIDPHFLYNSFFILNKRIRTGESKNALALSQALAEYFQYVTHNAQDIMPLSAEVDHAYNYAGIQQVRFANRLTLVLDRLPESCTEIPVPRLILQPVLENVFRHVIDKDQNSLSMKIWYEASDRKVEIHIEDSGSTLSDETIRMLTEKLEEQDTGQEISGLVNVHKRLQLFYGEDYGVTLSRSSLSGLHVKLSIGVERGGANEASAYCR